jgi:D-glycero-alpha-D-manno-heptose-7-phosphate kinase
LQLASQSNAGNGTTLAVVLPETYTMIITRSPLRITLGGGGTDLPSYYRNHGGFLIAAALDKYVYVTLHQPFSEDIILKYSSMETARTLDEVQHPIIREALKLVGVPNRIEIASMADIPSGTGLGSSGSFTTALLRALHMLKKNAVTPAGLAEQACHVELDLLKEPIGKQDQYVAAFGGLNCFAFCPNGQVEVTPLQIPPEALHNLEDNLLLLFTGFSRKAADILKDQDTRSRQDDPQMVQNLHFLKQLGYESKSALEKGDLRGFAELMHVHWEHKKARSKGMSNSRIDECYEFARANGALGGKLIGAGGGGFLMFYTEDKTRLRHAMLDEGLQETRFRFDFEGTRVVAQS